MIRFEFLPPVLAQCEVEQKAVSFTYVLIVLYSKNTILDPDLVILIKYLIEHMSRIYMNWEVQN